VWGQAGMRVLLNVRCEVNLCEPEGEWQASGTEGGVLICKPAIDPRNHTKKHELFFEKFRVISWIVFSN
jgi:hypothetical protein